MAEPSANQFCIPIYNGLCDDKFMRHTTVRLAGGDLHVESYQYPIEGWPKFREGWQSFGDDYFKMRLGCG